MNMTYKEAREYIKGVSKTGSILGLESIQSLMRELSDVQDQIPVIHIAGTNGKGSVGCYLSALLQGAGLTVGRYCSPAVFDPLEVWQCNDCNITETEYANMMSQVRTACDIVVSKGGSYPTVFEVETAAAFLYFYQKNVDVLLLETGMGGRTDATNLIKKPLASVFTTISMDHMQFLGNTLEEIAKVKAGIIKEGCPVFSTVQDVRVQKVLTQEAKQKDAPIVLLSQTDLHLRKEEPGSLEFDYLGVEYETQMAGSYQVENASLALMTFEGIKDALGLTESAEEQTIKEQITKEQSTKEQFTKRQCIKKAYWPGRFEVLSRQPLFIIDGAHNEDAAVRLSETVQNCFTNRRIIYIIGVLADKEHEKMLQIMLPHASRVFTVTPDNPRAMDGRLLAEEASRYHDQVQYCKNMSMAVQKALQENEPVLAFGSLSYLGQLKKTFYNVQTDRKQDSNDR